MSRKAKHIRQQVAIKAAELIIEEGINDYAFAKRKAAKFFGHMEENALPSNNEIKVAIKEHQAIFFDKEHEVRLRALRLEALNLMKKLSAFNPYLTGDILDGNINRHPTLHIHLYTDSMKEVEFFLLNHNIKYETSDQKLYAKDSMQIKKLTPVLTFEGSLGPIKLLIFQLNDIKKNSLQANLKQIKDLMNKESAYFN